MNEHKFRAPRATKATVAKYLRHKSYRATKATVSYKSCSYYVRPQLQNIHLQSCRATKASRLHGLQQSFKSYRASKATVAKYSHTKLQSYKSFKASQPTVRKATELQKLQLPHKLQLHVACSCIAILLRMAVVID